MAIRGKNWFRWGFFAMFSAIASRQPGIDLHLKGMEVITRPAHHRLISILHKSIQTCKTN